MIIPYYLKNNNLKSHITIEADHSSMVKSNDIERNIKRVDFLAKSHFILQDKVKL